MILKTLMSHAEMMPIVQVSALVVLPASNAEDDERAPDDHRCCRCRSGQSQLWNGTMAPAPPRCSPPR